MAGMNGNLNNSQRKALVKIVEKEYGRRIEKQRKICEQAKEQVTREVKSELGVARLDDEKKQLEKRMAEIDAQKEQFGFSKYSNVPLAGSQAQKMIAQGVRSEKEKLSEIELEQEKTVTKLWTETDLLRGRAIVNSLIMADELEEDVAD